MKGRILIIEDDIDINNVVTERLQQEGYTCRQCFSGVEAKVLVEREDYDLALMDLTIPGISGRELLPFIRERGIPVIVVTAIDALHDKVELLKEGASDYITKPFEFPELLARIMVQFRDAAGIKNTAPMLNWHELSVDRRSHQTFHNGQQLTLTKQETKILELLMSSPGQVFTKNDIYNYAWDDMYLDDDKTISVHISNIRRKLKTVTSREYIETLWGIGFRLAK